MKKEKNTLFALAVALLCSLAAPATAQEPVEPKLPLTQSPSTSYVSPAPLSFAQQQARFEAEQRSMRIEWNRWIGHSPLRPHMNASYMSNGVQTFYIPSRSVFVSAGGSRGWYW